MEDDQCRKKIKLEDDIISEKLAKTFPGIDINGN